MEEHAATPVGGSHVTWRLPPLTVAEGLGGMLRSFTFTIWLRNNGPEALAGTVTAPTWRIEQSPLLGLLMVEFGPKQFFVPLPLIHRSVSSTGRRAELSEVRSHHDSTA